MQVHFVIRNTASSRLAPTEYLSVSLGSKRSDNQDFHILFVVMLKREYRWVRFLYKIWPNREGRRLKLGQL